MIDQGDYATARRLRREFEEDLRLLDDLGWAEEEPADSFELTMAPDELASAMRRLHDEACGALREHVLREHDEAQADRRYAVACSAYDAVLGQIAGFQRITGTET
jgi:hypothetical protein